MGVSDYPWTPTQVTILDCLSDGKPHTKKELISLFEEMGDKNLINHISVLRKLLKMKGEDIVCRFGTNRTYYYQHVRLLHRPGE